MTRLRFLLLALMCCALTACSQQSPDPPPLTISRAEAARFLMQTTFGPRLDEIDEVVRIGYTAWIERQMAVPFTSQIEGMRHHPGRSALARVGRLEVWWDTAINGPDQLRQRVALALSEILVVSDQSPALARDGRLVADFHDILARNAFGNFRTLLEEVTLSPAMGLYLNMLGNRKADPAHGVHADENYAREIMQLFTVGLVMLAPDGSVRHDATGQAIPTYTQADVEALARVFTGWTWGGHDFRGPTATERKPWPSPMTPVEDCHDADAKSIIGGVKIAPGLTARAELTVALDTLCRHPNVGPFIGRQLIQRLVTSNPSPAYVARVAAVFDDNGHGQRGDLGAVVRAILLDVEARSTSASGPRKIREPLRSLVHLWRTFRATSPAGVYAFSDPQKVLGQGPFSAPSVFGFFLPTWSPPGPLRAQGLVAPELQLLNPASATAMNTLFADRIFRKDIARVPGMNPKWREFFLDLSAVAPLVATDIDGALERFDLLLMGGRMSQAMRTILRNHLLTIDASQDAGSARAEEALYLIFTSPQYTLEY